MDRGDARMDMFKAKTEEFFAELGSYFAADGSLDDKAFRQSLKKSLEYIKAHSQDECSFSSHVNTWLSAKLHEIIDYLHDKGMPEASFRLFRTAIEVCASLGLPDIALPTENLAYILSHAQDSRPRREKINTSNKKRERVIDAALTVFDRDGFHRATMDEIAKLADVGKGSVYRYFKNKDDLLQCILVERTEQFFEDMNIVFSLEIDLAERIRRIIEGWVHFIHANQELYGLIQNIIQINGTTTRDIFFTQMLIKLPMLKERSVAVSHDDRTRVTEQTFETIFTGGLGFVDWVYYKWIRAGKSYNLLDEVPIIVDMLLYGCLVERRP